MEILQFLLGPLILLPLLFVVGLQLVPDDFRRVLAAPRTVVVGTLGQLLLLPVMTFGLATLLDISPILAAGAMLLAAAPGAGTSNAIAAMAGANVALSVTLTAMSSILAIVTLPPLAAVGMGLFVGDSGEVQLPVGMLVSQLLFFIAFPIGFGMFVRAKRPEASERYQSRANRFAVAAIVVLVILGAMSNRESLPGGSLILWSILAAALWTGAAMAVGLGVAALLRLDDNDRFTFLIVFSARNLALAIVVAVASLGRLDLSFFATAYSMVGLPLVVTVAILRGKRLAPAASVPSR